MSMGKKQINVGKSRGKPILMLRPGDEEHL